MEFTDEYQRGWLCCRMSEISASRIHDMLGQLGAASARHRREVTPDQMDAWRQQLEILAEVADATRLRRASSGEWHAVLEYSIPRRGRRIDVVVLARGNVIPIEFKVGSRSFDRGSVWQAEDYALDIRDFHLKSRGRVVRPVLVATEYEGASRYLVGEELEVFCTGTAGLIGVFEDLEPAPSIDPVDWDRSGYSPTPDIVDATKRVFAQQQVADLSRSAADDLVGTVERIHTVISESRNAQTRTVVFVTGVPGAGKTLAGLAASSAAVDGSDFRAAYMSGNGPLVAVLREAVARDALDRQGSLKSARRYSSALIQNVHEFTRLYGVERPDLAPDEHVVVFDEAQRAWDAQKLSQRYAGITRSEPAVMLDAMSRTEGWCVLVALVGSGQEIHDGEAGLKEWVKAIAHAPIPWRVVGSSQVGDAMGQMDVQSSRCISLEIDDSCHLAVSTRSPRAKCISNWVDAFLEFNLDDAASALDDLSGFRLAMTRDLDAARSWLRDAARDEMRPGMLASSGARRLRAHGIEMSSEFLDSIPLERWFLDHVDDYRSSHSLEVALSEFKVQGLEIDFSCVCWAGDLIPSNGGSSWRARRLWGQGWRDVRNARTITYALNKYRVLLTRAREGMVIWVPRGCEADRTRDPEELDAVADALKRSGIPEV